MVKTVIFDLGGVIITLNQDEAVRRFVGLGLADARQQLDPYTQSGIFGDVEEGKIDAETFRAELSNMVCRELTFDECKHAWLGYKADLPKRNLDVLRKLRSEGYRLILLSNTNPFMMSWGLSADFDGEGHSLKDYFDALYLSYEQRMMKPSVDLFRHVIAAENLNPAETLLVDDGERNVEAAARLGLKTFKPVNGEDWTADIYENLK